MYSLETTKYTQLTTNSSTKLIINLNLFQTHLKKKKKAAGTEIEKESPPVVTISSAEKTQNRYQMKNQTVFDPSASIPGSVFEEMK